MSHSVLLVVLIFVLILWSVFAVNNKNPLYEGIFNVLVQWHFIGVLVQHLIGTAENIAAQKLNPLNFGH